MNPNTLLLPTVWPRALPTTVQRCVLLALLLHVWLVLMLGSAPGGTARPGEGVWGAINITLRGVERPGAAELPPLPAPVEPTGPVGTAAAPRWGGSVRPVELPAPPDPGAAQLGNWAPTPALRAPLSAQPLQDSRSPPPTAPPEPATPATPALQASPTPQAAPAREPERSLTSSLAREPIRAAQALRIDSGPAPLVSVPLLTPPRLPDMAAQALAPAITPPVPPPPAPSTVAPVAAPAAAELPPTPPPLRQLSQPASEAPRQVAPLQRETAVAVPVPDTAITAPPSATLMPTPARSTSVPAPAPAQIPAQIPAPAGLPSPGMGAADAGAQVGHDVASPPSAAASTLPRLNLQLARPRGGELSRGASGGVLSLLPRLPDVPDKLGKEIEKAAKPDCRTAYAGAGLLAVVPLAIDAVRKESACKW